MRPETFDALAALLVASGRIDAAGIVAGGGW